MAVIAFILLLPLVYIVLPISIGYSRSETACADAYSYGAPASSVYKGGYTRFSFFPSKDGVGMCLAFPSDGE